MTGKDIIVTLSQNSTALASTAIKSDDIQTRADLIEKASATQQGWREYIAGLCEWSLNVSYLVLAAAKIRDVLMVGQVFDITLSHDNVTLTGQAILSYCKQTHTVGNLAQGSFSFQGNGPLQ